MKRLLLCLLLTLSGGVACVTAQEAPQAWVLPDIRAPRVQRLVFASDCAAQNVSCYVYTPDAYASEPERRFPVLYWLHGSGGSSPAAVAQVSRRYGQAMRDGLIPPMILVFPNGLPMGMWCDWKDGSVKLESLVIGELIPLVDRTFRTQATRQGRLIEGFSMGGYGAARLAFKHPHLFAAVSLLGAGPLQPDFSETPRAGPRQRDEVFATAYGNDMAYYREQSPWHLAQAHADRLRSGLLIRQLIGNLDATLRFNRDFHDHLTALKIPHTYRQVPGVPHDPNRLLDALGADLWPFYQQALAPVPASAPPAPTVQ